MKLKPLLKQYLTEQSLEGIKVNDNFKKWFGDSKAVLKNLNRRLVIKENRNNKRISAHTFRAIKIMHLDMLAIKRHRKFMKYFCE